jgi:hypothetical protein
VPTLSQIKKYWRVKQRNPNDALKQFIQRHLNQVLDGHPTVKSPTVEDRMLRIRICARELERRSRRNVSAKTER